MVHRCRIAQVRATFEPIIPRLVAKGEPFHPCKTGVPNGMLRWLLPYRKLSGIERREMTGKTQRT